MFRPLVRSTLKLLYAASTTALVNNVARKNRPWVPIVKKMAMFTRSSPQRRARGRCCPHTKRRNAVQKLFRASSEVLARGGPRAALSELSTRSRCDLLMSLCTATNTLQHAKLVHRLSTTHGSKQRRPRAVPCRFTARWTPLVKTHDKRSGASRQTRGP